MWLQLLKFLTTRSIFHALCSKIHRKLQILVLKYDANQNKLRKGRVVLKRRMMIMQILLFVYLVLEESILHLCHPNISFDMMTYLRLLALIPLDFV